MGYGYYTVRRNGIDIEAGYTVPDTCTVEGCTEEIDRGLAHLCGSTPGGDEHGCGFYFCSRHLFMPPEGVPGEGLCENCWDKAEKASTAPAGA